MTIDATAKVAATAVIGAGSSIGPYAIIEDGVQIGKNVRVAAHAIVRKGTILGNEVWIDSFAVIGGDPQSLTFDPSLKTGVIIGDAVRVREGVTIHRATEPEANTVLGAGGYLMAQSHIGHDCVVGKNVVICNNVMLGGHVQLGDRAFIGGGVGIHQFCRVGRLAMLGGNASIALDVPPYVMVADRGEARGLNLVGLRRAKLSSSELSELKQCYQKVFLRGMNVKQNAKIARVEHFAKTAAGLRFLEFFEHSKRGFITARRSKQSVQDAQS